MIFTILIISNRNITYFGISNTLFDTSFSLYISISTLIMFLHRFIVLEKLATFKKKVYAETFEQSMKHFDMIT